MKYKFLKLINFILLLIGLYIIYSICLNIGWNIILNKILSIQIWQFLILLILPISWNILHSLAWFFVLDHKKYFNITSLFRAHIASTAVAEILPLGQAGGESYRMLYLKKKCEKETTTASPNIVASVILYNTIHSFATGIFMASGFLIIIALIDVSLTKKIVVISTLIVCFMVLLFIIERQRKGFVLKVFKFLNRFKIFRPYVEKRMVKAQMVDERLNDFYSNHKKYFYFSSFLLYASKFIGGIEIYLILTFIGDPSTLILAIFIFAGKAFAQILLFFFPAQIGATEGSIYYLFTVLGLHPVSGITTALFIRLRTVIWTIFGLIVAYFYGPMIFQDKSKKI